MCTDYVGFQVTLKNGFSFVVDVVDWETRAKSIAKWRKYYKDKGGFKLTFVEVSKAFFSSVSYWAQTMFGKSFFDLNEEQKVSVVEMMDGM